MFSCVELTQRFPISVSLSHTQQEEKNLRNLKRGSYDWAI